MAGLSYIPLLFDFMQKANANSEQIIDWKLLGICIVLAVFASLSRQTEQSSIESISLRESKAIVFSGIIMGVISFLIASVWNRSVAITGLISIGMALYGVDILRTIRLSVPNLIKSIISKIPDLLITIIKSKTGSNEDDNSKP